MINQPEERSPLLKDEEVVVSNDAAGNNRPRGEDEEQTVTFHGVSSTISNEQSIMNLLKANIGTGILALPAAIRYGGLALGSIGLALMGVIAIHCMHILVQTSHMLLPGSGLQATDYGQLGELAFMRGPSWSRKMVFLVKPVVNVFLCITQLGFCIVYILFIAQNIEQVIESGGLKWDLPVQVYMTVITLLLVPYSLIRHLRTIAHFSALANVLQLVGLGIVLYYCVSHKGYYISQLPAVGSLTNLPLFFGIAMFAFEGIGVVLPIENKMRFPRDFLGLAGVLNTAMVITTCLYIAVGFYGYLQFGNDIKGSVTLNLPTDQWLYLLVKLLFSMAIFLTFGVQFYVPVVIMWPVLLRCFPRLNNHARLTEACFRIVVVLFCFAISAVVPHLDLMISLVGALSSSALALIFPALFNSLALYHVKDYGRLKWKLFKNIFIVIFGLFGLVTGTLTTLFQIVQAFEHKNPKNKH